MRKSLAIATSDWHITAERPRSRLKGYQEQQYNKVEFILELARKNNAVLLNAGDIFDRPREPRSLVAKYLKLFSKYLDDMYPHCACAGQHDQSFQSMNLSDTSIGLLYAADFLATVDSNFWHVMQEGPLDDHEELVTQDIHCKDWGDESMFDVTGTLVAHFCVTEKPIDFIDYSLTATEFLEKTKARTVVTGDYHKTHTKKIGDRLLINPGSIMRNASDTISREPSVFLVDIEHNEIVDQISIPVKPPEEVFDMKVIEQAQERKQNKQTLSEQFEAYATRVKESSTFEIDFRGELNNLVTHLKPSNEVREEITTIIGE